MKFQVLFSLTKNEIIFMDVVCCICESINHDNWNRYISVNSADPDQVKSVYILFDLNIFDPIYIIHTYTIF